MPATSQSAFMRKLWTLYLALLAALPAYGAFAWVKTAMDTPRPGEAMPFLPALIVVAAMEMVVILPFLRRRMMPPRREATSLGGEGAAIEGSAMAATQRYFTVQVLSWAMCESVALYGLVLSFLTARPIYYAGFAVASTLCFALYRPSAAVLDEVVRAARAS
jgi:hypothetical protein